MFFTALRLPPFCSVRLRAGSLPPQLAETRQAHNPDHGQGTGGGVELLRPGLGGV